MGRTNAWKLSLVLMLAGACTSANREDKAKHSEDGGADAESPASHSDDEESQPSHNHDDEQAEVDASVPEDVPEDAGTHPEKDSNVAPKTDVPSTHNDETHRDEPALPRTEDPPVHEPALEPLPSLPHPREGVCAFLPPADPAFHVDNVNCPDGIVRGNVSLQSDADVEKLRGCTRVHGNVEVYADNVSSVAALDALQVIDGALHVSTEMHCNAESSPCSFPSAPLASLAGLDGLRCLGDALWVSSGSRKIAVDALHNVVEIGGTVTLIGIKESADTFSSLRRVWGDLDAASHLGLFALPRLEAVYGHYYRGVADGNISVGCGETGNYCRDGVLGCSVVAKTESDLAQLSNCEIVRG
ncbi:MAG TPA: hypothetical protein VFN67_36160, partial [Polyangiales bacterium]|nr:hypothetical protein [Polyangiales bacterium]